VCNQAPTPLDNPVEALICIDLCCPDGMSYLTHSETVQSAVEQLAFCRAAEASSVSKTSEGFEITLSISVAVDGNDDEATTGGDDDDPSQDSVAASDDGSEPETDEEAGDSDPSQDSVAASDDGSETHRRKDGEICGHEVPEADCPVHGKAVDDSQEEDSDPSQDSVAASDDGSEQDGNDSSQDSGAASDDEYPEPKYPPAEQIGEYKFRCPLCESYEGSKASVNGHKPHCDSSQDSVAASDDESDTSSQDSVAASDDEVPHPEEADSPTKENYRVHYGPCIDCDGGAYNEDYDRCYHCLQKQGIDPSQDSSAASDDGSKADRVQKVADHFPSKKRSEVEAAVEAVRENMADTEGQYFSQQS
jgi:hypothetical protein